jgi:tRNA 2-thiouridine synthesizing protein A
MTGHHYLDPAPDDERPVYALRIAADARPTRASAPWHADNLDG